MSAIGGEAGRQAVIADDVQSPSAVTLPISFGGAPDVGIGWFVTAPQSLGCRDQQAADDPAHEPGGEGLSGEGEEGRDEVHERLPTWPASIEYGQVETIFKSARRYDQRL